MKYSKKLQAIINKQGIRLDIGCGQSKMPGFVGMDNRPLKGVDIVWDVMKFPYPLPDNCCQVIMMSHLAEHIPPFGTSPQLSDLVTLLLKKSVITVEEAQEYVGEYKIDSYFMRMMDELWRVLKVGGQLMLAVPYAGSTGYWGDPTHIHGINERLWEYFDPDGEHSRGLLYHLYEPKPWKIDLSAYQTEGNMEIVLIKRADKPKYHQYTKFTDAEKKALKS